MQRLIGEGLVKVNGKSSKPAIKPRQGDEIDMVAPPEPISELVPEDIPLEIDLTKTSISSPSTSRRT